MVLIALAALVVVAQDFNVKDFGATGRKADDARAAIQAAIDACAAAGGGRVYLPPGEYTSGELRLRSHVRLEIEAGATLLASTDMDAFAKGALLYGEDLDGISIEGRGTIDGQSEYEWRPSDLDDAYLRGNELRMKELGKPLLRPFPKGFPRRSMYPRMILLLRCNNVRVAGLTLVRSPSWNITPYACEHLVIDGVQIRSSLKEGVWADGIDPDGCKDVHIANCTIETGDDAIVFYSSSAWGPALPCENITVTNCRLSSASSALKFCDGNSNCIRRVVVDNCVITQSNRGIAFMVFDGGTVSDVVLSNLVIECVRYDWYWWGDCDPIHFNVRRRSEIDGRMRDREPVGRIENVLISNVIARGQGTCAINGHPDSRLVGITLDHVQLIVSADPSHPMQRTQDAMRFRWIDDLTLEDVEVRWESPASGDWQSALRLEDVDRLTVDSFSGGQGGARTVPVIVLEQVRDATLRSSTAREGSGPFLRVLGDRTRDVFLSGNDLRRAAAPLELGPGVGPGVVTSSSNRGASEK